MERHTSTIVLLLLPIAGALLLPPFPPLWNAAPSGTVALNGTVNAWNYTHRLAMYKQILQGSAGHCLWKSNPQQLGNPVWGLPLQHGWQAFSGRLCINTSKGETGMQPGCWWACANYYFSVFPYLGAVEAGIVPPNLHLAATPGGDPTGQFCDGQLPGCRMHPAVRNWARFFNTVQQTSSDCTAGSEPTPDSPLMSMLMSRYWDGHTATLNATAQCNAHLSALSHPEQAFGRGWSNLVSFLGPTRFDVNYTMSSTLQQLLPYRTLVDTDTPGRISDMDQATNRGILLVEALDTANDKSGGFFLQAWQNAMCSEAAREQARDAINRGLTDVTVLVEDTIKILWDFAFSTKNCTKP